MRGAVALLCLLGGMSVRGATARVEGYPVTVGPEIKAGGEAVSLRFRLYEAQLGPQKGTVASGYAVSQLPSQWFKVKVTIRFWDVYPQKKDVFERARASFVLDRPKPGQRVKWRAILWSPHAEKKIEPFAHPKPIYTVTTEFEKAMPKRKGEQG